MKMKKQSWMKSNDFFEWKLNMADDFIQKENLHQEMWMWMWQKLTKKEVLKFNVNVTETNKERNVKIKCECDKN